mmetsp:Transcript_133382/g.243095  ORF Transcript_133382/g.243095 Transcript_133382/m.243095 type:complete len:203 (-) Transcript_133382:84-692(-)
MLHETCRKFAVLISILNVAGGHKLSSLQEASEAPAGQKAMAALLLATNPSQAFNPGLPSRAAVTSVGSRSLSKPLSSQRVGVRALSKKRSSSLVMEEAEEGKKGLSMADIKKYGVAGTVAYILTELAFWAVAFPVASTTFYNLNNHWPDLGDNSDRAAVLGFIFAGANIARLAVPLRLGAAIALVPWVDGNIVQRFGNAKEA